MVLTIPFTHIILYSDEPGDYLAPETDIEGYLCEPGNLVSDGKRVGMVYRAAAPSPFYGDPDWRVYVGNLPGEPAWSDYWSVFEVEII